MADLQRTIEIIFGGKDNLSPTTKSILKDLGGFSSAVEGFTAPIAAVTDSILKFDAAIVALGTAAAAFAINEAVKFQAAQLDLKKVLDDSDPSIDTYTASVDDLSVTYGESATNILAGIANFKQAGFTAEESAKLQAAALDLVIAGDLAASEASDLLISTLIGFKLPASEATAVIDSLNEVSNKYATDVEQLAIGLAKLSPVAEAMGFSFQETEGLLTPVIEVFRSGSEASDALKTGLLKLIDDAKPVGEALASIGVNQKDANGELRSGKDILFDVAAAFKGLDEKQKLFITAQLVGIEQSARMVTVFDNLSGVTEVTTTAMHSAGSAAKEVAIRLESAEVQGKRMVVAFENLARAAGNELLANFGGIAGGVTDLEVAFKEVVESGGLAPLFEALKPKLAEFEAVLRTVAANLPEAFSRIDFSDLLDAFGNLGDQLIEIFEGVFGEMDLSTPQGLARALQSVTDAFTALINITSGILSVFQPLFAAFGDLVARASSSGEETQIMAGKFLGAAELVAKLGLELGALTVVLAESRADIHALGEVVFGVGGLIKNGFEVVADVVLGTLAELGKAIYDFINLITAGAFSDTFGKLSADMDAIIRRSVENLAVNSLDAEKSLGLIGDGLAGLFSGDKKQAIDGATKGLQTIGTSATEASQATDSFEPIDLGNVDFVAEAMKRLGIATQSEAQALGEVDQILNANLDTRRREADALITAEERARGYHVEISDMGEAVIHTGQKIEANSEKLDKNAAKFQKAEQDAREFRLQMEEIASEERIHLFEASFKFNTAALEEETKQVEAAFESIDNTVTSTGELISDLFLGLSKVDEFDKTKIFEQIKEENRRRDEALKLQKELVEKQTKLLQARIDRLNAGDFLLKVEASGIEPAIEMIFDEILKKAQVKAAEEGLELLLGV